MPNCRTRQAIRAKLSVLPVGARVTVYSFGDKYERTARRLLVELENQLYLESQPVEGHNRVNYTITRRIPLRTSWEPDFEPLLRIFGYAVRELAGKPKVHRNKWQLSG